jgi:hypothetical protein
MSRPKLEVADIFRRHGEAWRRDSAGHVSCAQLRVMSAIEACRTAALGGHVERCEDCAHTRVAYNSCRNRHCPKCQWAAAAQWLAAREAELLPVPYYHVVFTLPAQIGAIAYQNKAKVYGLLFTAAAETHVTIATDPRHLGAKIGLTAVLHTWGQNLHHHPHVHCVVTGGGLSCNAQGDIDAAPHWVSCRPGFFLPVRVLSRVFRGKYLASLRQAVVHGKLTFGLDAEAFTQWLATLYAKEWVVYAKPPFGGPERVLKYLARYTHRVAISNHRLVKLDNDSVTFRYKDYSDDHRLKTMTLSATEFLRRFVQHVLPRGFVKVRHYGLLANRHRQVRLEVCRRLLLVVIVATALADTGSSPTHVDSAPRPCCSRCGSERLTTMELLKAEAMLAACDTS